MADLLTRDELDATIRALADAWKAMPEGARICRRCLRVCELNAVSACPTCWVDNSTGKRPAF
jgi:hypothetical protein